jgi:pentatricopeptide repeat protein
MMVATYNLLVLALFMDGRALDAYVELEEMQNNGLSPNVFTYNVLINGYCKEGNEKKTLEVFEDLSRKGVLTPFLQDKEKKVLLVAIPLQATAYIVVVVVGEPRAFLQGWATWNQILSVDVACYCDVVFLVVWSIRSLRESFKTDIKAARTLAKLTLFRQFYVVVIGYLYFTRIILYTNYKYRWVSVVAEEVSTMASYMFMF